MKRKEILSASSLILHDCQKYDTDKNMFLGDKIIFWNRPQFSFVLQLVNFSFNSTFEEDGIYIIHVVKNEHSSYNILSICLCVINFLLRLCDSYQTLKKRLEIFLDKLLISIKGIFFSFISQKISRRDNIMSNSNGLPVKQIIKH